MAATCDALRSECALTSIQAHNHAHTPDFLIGGTNPKGEGRVDRGVGGCLLRPRRGRVTRRRWVEWVEDGR